MIGEIVKIESKDFESGFVIIDADDFDPETMKLFVEKDAPAKAEEDLEDPAVDKAHLMKFNKADLIAKAVELGIEVVPDEVTKDDLCDLILAVEAK